MPPPQPTLRDGNIVLRPWTDDDIEVAPHTAAVRDWQAAYQDDRRVVNFLVSASGRPAGSVEVRQSGDGRGQLSWILYAGHRGQGIASRAVRLLLRYAFDELGLVRLEAYVDPDNVPSLRLAARCGLRREGRLRAWGTTGDQRRDHVLLARLATDADPNSRDARLAVLNASLPTKRVIAQGLLHDDRGRVLLCELTYKPEWDLPGGVVELGESPARAVVREVSEELGVETQVCRLVTVNWLQPWRGWDDACLFVFDMGVLAADSQLRLQPSEVLAAHWCDIATVGSRAAPWTATLLRYLDSHQSVATYLEAGVATSLP